MRGALTLLVSSLLVATSAQAAPQSPEAELAKALQGRVAGEPVDCIYLRDIRGTEIIDDTAIIYEHRNGTYYLNRPSGGAQGLDDWDILVTKTHTGQLCSIDTVELHDPSVRMMTGIVFLGDFVPYKKVKTAAVR